jgi:hypothetical protein
VSHLLEYAIVEARSRWMGCALSADLGRFKHAQNGLWISVHANSTGVAFSVHIILIIFLDKRPKNER